MSAPDKPTPPDFDEDFLQALAQWREKYKIRDDDVILPLMELFRIHQNHWDEMRSRQMPSLDQFRRDIGLLSEVAKTFKDEVNRRTGKVDVATAFFAALAALLAGFLIGKALL